MKDAARWRPSRGFVYTLLGILIFLLIALSPGGSFPQTKHNAAMQQSRSIGQCLFMYASDHGNVYPNGKSSTEIFQKLLDEQYANDPELFFLPLAGKVKALPGQKLKPENVCWDVTAGVDSSSSNFVPFVFMTGYKMTYAPDGSAVPVIKPFPPYWSDRTWREWWNGIGPPSNKHSPGLAVFYKGNNAVYLWSDSDYSVPNVISSDFMPDGKRYRQLTPDGVLQ